MYQHILLPTDGSAAATHAVDTGIKLPPLPAVSFLADVIQGVAMTGSSPLLK